MNISLYICMYLSNLMVKKKDRYISLKKFRDKWKQNMKIHTCYKALCTNNSLKDFACFLVKSLSILKSPPPPQKTPRC